MSLRRIAALYVKRNTIYRRLPGVDCFDVSRDARSFAGGVPVIAHPPCRLWSRMSHLSSAPESERLLALHAVEQVRTCGGVLEHPAFSKLWAAASLPAAGQWDAYGYTVAILQHDFGHPAAKPTWLYVVGVPPAGLPPVDLTLGEAQFSLGRHAGWKFSEHSKPGVPDKWRSATPPRLAAWLVEVARSARRPA